MWPLLVLSIISLACIFERFLFWINLNKQNNLLINYILENFEDKKNSEIFIKKLITKHFQIKKNRKTFNVVYFN